MAVRSRRFQLRDRVPLPRTRPRGWWPLLRERPSPVGPPLYSQIRLTPANRLSRAGLFPVGVRVWTRPGAGGGRPSGRGRLPIPGLLGSRRARRPGRPGLRWRRGSQRRRQLLSLLDRLLWASHLTQRLERSLHQVNRIWAPQRFRQHVAYAGSGHDRADAPARNDASAGRRRLKHYQGRSVLVNQFVGKRTPGHGDLYQVTACYRGPFSDRLRHLARLA